MRLTAEKKNHDVVQVYLRKLGGFTTHRRLAKRETIGKAKIEDAKKWVKKKGWTPRVSKGRYPFIILDNDTKMVKAPLAKKINTLGKQAKRYIWMGEGWRTHARQWELWNEYIARGKQPPLVAYPGTSNHEGGMAADISVFLDGPSNPYINVGNLSRTRQRMRNLGLCLPVPGEPWHAEIGNNWNA